MEIRDSLKRGETHRLQTGPKTNHPLMSSSSPSTCYINALPIVFEEGEAVGNGGNWASHFSGGPIEFLTKNFPHPTDPKTQVEYEQRIRAEERLASLWAEFYIYVKPHEIYDWHNQEAKEWGEKFLKWFKAERHGLHDLRLRCLRWYLLRL